MLHKLDAVTRLYGVMVLSLTVFTVVCLWTADLEDLESKYVPEIPQTEPINGTLPDLPAQPSFPEDKGEVICGPYRSNFLLYNRVPHSGSSSLLEVLKKLGEKNSFLQLGATLNTQAKFVNRRNAGRMAKSVLRHLHKEGGAVAFDASIRFLDFQWLHYAPIPLYINLVRDPVERAISGYYSQRFKGGDDKRKKREQEMSVDECLTQDAVNRTCGFRLEDANIMTKMFCGSHEICKCLDGDCNMGMQAVMERKAFDVARDNLVRRFQVVGILEEFRDTLRLLEKLVPDFFEGANEAFPEPPHLNIGIQRQKYPEPSAESRAILKAMNTWDAHLYSDAKEHFDRLKAVCLRDDDAKPSL